MLNGINCGGCGSAVAKALMAVDGVSDVVAQSKKDTGEPDPAAGRDADSTLPENQHKPPALTEKGEAEGDANGALVAVGGDDNSTIASKQSINRAHTPPGHGYRFQGFAPHEQVRDYILF